MLKATDTGAGPDSLRRLYVYNAGFLTQTRVRRILALAGWDVRIGMPGPEDWVGVWGQSPTSPRGEAVARHRDAPVLRVEDAFLRSLHPGRSGEPTLGLFLDRTGVHFDASGPSDLESLLATHPLDDPALLNAAKAAKDRMAFAQLSKFSATDPNAALPDGPYVVVIDQAEGDASVTASGADAATFRTMLDEAAATHHDLPVLIKSHPETARGHRPGYFGLEDQTEQIRILADPVSPWRLFDRAAAVYTVSSGLGAEAIWAGRRPLVFGGPIYAGWGLTEDRQDFPRRGRKLSAEQLFAAAMILAPTWYDPYHDRLCELDQVISTLSAKASAWRQDRFGYMATGMRLWKRPQFKAMFGPNIAFDRDPKRAAARAKRDDRTLLVWGRTETGPSQPERVVRTEDGFLRSRGLGAKLVPPLALVEDDEGIYFDPSKPSRLETLITRSVDLPEADVRRAEALIAELTQKRLTKYNIDAATPEDLPKGHKVLVVGQVEDDASVELGAPGWTNLRLLKAARAAHPKAAILFKPHPDVEAGLRLGAIREDAAKGLADLVAHESDPLALIEAVDEIWTMTSLLGFEALLRGRPVTCTGVPFYAGWGLTTDLGPIPDRRSAKPTLAQLSHAALIGYTRYFDPKTGQICPVEVLVDRLASGEDLPRTPSNRLLAKLQVWLPRRLGPRP